jgi:uncharacterized protein YgiM (DUF1202 family)
MLKLMSILAAGLFLTLLIVGEDNGQVRQGLVGIKPAAPAANKPVVQKVAAAPAATPVVEVTKKVTLANFAPVTVQKSKIGVSAPIAGAFVVGAALEVTQAEPEVVVATTFEAPVMYVSSSAVNVRAGPSTDYEVVGRLIRAEAVTVVSAADEGWVQIRIEGDGIEGFVAARLLTDIDPSN